MNKVFKIIWNNVTQSFVVVSELARNRGKLSSEMKKSNVVNLLNYLFYHVYDRGLPKYKLNLLLEAWSIVMFILMALLLVIVIQLQRAMILSQ